MMSEIESDYSSNKAPFAFAHIQNGLDRLGIAELSSLNFRAEQNFADILQGVDFVLPLGGDKQEEQGSLLAMVRAVPQANGMHVVFATIYLSQKQDVDIPQLVRHTRSALYEVIDRVSLSTHRVRSIALNCLSSDLSLKELYQELGAFPFCYYPFLPLEEALEVEGGSALVRPAARSGEQLRMDAQILAEFAHEYRQRRSQFEERSWPKPDENHIERHANYFAEQVLPQEKNAAFLVETGGEVVAAGVGVLRSTELTTPSGLSPLYDQTKVLCELDDFFVRKGLDWESYGSDLFAAIVSKVAKDRQNELLGVFFTQNHLDIESIAFAHQIGAKPFREFYLLYPEDLA